jgi:hypothetical protein
MASPTDINQYFTDRMDLLGVTDQENQVGIWRYDKDEQKNVVKPLPVFSPSDKGIDILVYSLDRRLISYKDEPNIDPVTGKQKALGSGESRWSKNYCITRLKDPIVKKDGSVQKYHIPKGQGTYPFFHPSLVEAFEKEKPLDTLFLIEGYFKAFKGCMHGIPVVGLSSITHMKDKETSALHPDILKLMFACKVKRMVWLTDGDCLDITSKELKDGMDLYKRPKNFFSSCETFKALLDDYGDVDKWFFHIDTDNILSLNKSIRDRDKVKGLDDLLVALPGRIDEIKQDIMSVSRAGEFFQKFNITTSTRKVWQHFHLSNVNEFYHFHQERRKDLKEIEFVYNGTRYKYEEKDNECKVVTPAQAKLYFRVGDTYYKFIEKINQFGQIEKGFEKRMKTTITDDHGKDFAKHIPKYEAFCNVPSHTEFQPILYNCFNVYSPFEHEPHMDDCDENDCPNIIAFFKHIFGTHPITVKQGKDQDNIRTENFQLGLDYVQLLYQRPTQRLPILSLVSRENETGKSTFGDLMKAIFTNNAAVVGNSDLADDFNSFWATKLLIMCDETKIDKQAVVERVKSLTFAKKIGLNAKGKDKVEIDFFGKFMFFTNNEENFIYASEEDLRYWIIKVPRIKEKNPDFLQNMLDEIPSFLSFLNHRKLLTPRMTRMWFDPELLKTEALRKVIAFSQSTVKKELHHYLRDMFLDFGVDDILMSCKVIRENFFKNKEENYIERVLKEEMHMKPVQFYVYKDINYDTELEAMAACGADGLNELEAYAAIKVKGRVMRYKYPKWDLKTDFASRASERIAVWVSEMGRPYKFLRKDFVGADEMTEIPQELVYQAALEPEVNGTPVTTAPGRIVQASIDDLPF